MRESIRGLWDYLWDKITGIDIDEVCVFDHRTRCSVGCRDLKVKYMSRARYMERFDVLLEEDFLVWFMCTKFVPSISLVQVEVTI